MSNRKKIHELQNSKEKKNKPAEEKKNSAYRGLLLAVLSGVFYSIAAVIVKRIENIHPGQLTVYRFLAIFVFSLPEAVKCQENLLGPKDMRLLLAIRGLSGATNVFLMFIAFRYLPLGESAAIIYSRPVFITMAARVFLKEPCGIFQTVAVFTTLVGIIFTTKLPLKLSENSIVYSTETVWGILAAIGSLFFATCQCISLRKLKSVHHSIIMLNFGWIGVTETIILTGFFGDFKWHYCGFQSFFIIMIGVLGYAAQALMTMALLCEMAGPVSTCVSAVELLLAFVWQTLLFRDIPEVFSSVGAVLVGLSVIFVALTKWVSNLPSDSTYGQKFGWILK